MRESSSRGQVRWVLKVDADLQYEDTDIKCSASMHQMFSSGQFVQKAVKYHTAKSFIVHTAGTSYGHNPTSPLSKCTLM